MSTPYSEPISLWKKGKIKPLGSVKQLAWKIRDHSGFTRGIRGQQISAITGPANAQQYKKK